MSKGDAADTLPRHLPSPTIISIMGERKLSTEPYRGVRDFYPEEMALRRHIFDTWSRAAERFGFERYDASVLEPAELYRSKGAKNEEIVRDQTYTFTDRGGREVTLRPEMTPSVARLVSRRRRELSFPLRWYSIPNLFRYERPQRGRLREHWQLNCDIFGVKDCAADIEIIALAHQIFLSFGATLAMFEIQVNDRALMSRLYRSLNISDEMALLITRLNDRRRKMSDEDYRAALIDITKDKALAEEVILMLDQGDETGDIMPALKDLGIKNAVFNRSLARGFDYYTGAIFEIFDKHPNGATRSLLGGGRYDNLTALFGGAPIPGVGFGLGDVTMVEFLTTHNLLPQKIAVPTALVAIIPTGAEHNLAALKTAETLRAAGHNAEVNFGDKKLGRKLSDASARAVRFALVVGENELTSGRYTLKDLRGGETTGTLDELSASLKGAGV
jgi:histidyl-tRNA synthetase